MKISQEKLNQLTTEADRLYCSAEDGDAYDDVQDFVDDVRDFLDVLINVLEAEGGRVEGLKYLK